MRNIRRYRQKRQFGKSKYVITVMILIGLLVSIGRIDQKKDTFVYAMKEEIKKTAYGGMVKSYMPGLMCQTQTTSDKKTAAEMIQEKVAAVLPLFSYIQTQSDYQPPAESSLSYDVIAQREAMDENYIDETTGEVMVAAENENEEEVLSEAETENAKIRQQQEAQTEKQTEAQTEAAQPQPEQPASEAPANATTTDTIALADNQIGNFQIQTQPVANYAMEKLNDFDYLIQNFYTVDRTTTINSGQLNAQQLLSEDLHMKTTADQPQILIYHTHSQEMFADSGGDVMKGVMGCGEYLTQILQQKYGFNVIHHMGEYDVESRDYAYAKAEPAIEQLLADNPSIEVVIDLHRDASNEDTHMVRDVQGVQMAPIMFFNGLSRLADKGDIASLVNPYIQDNLAFSLQMELQASEYYPTLTRHIYLKGYRYNMHFRPKTLLVELGSQTNTYEEAQNAMAPLADLLHKVLCE